MKTSGNRNASVLDVPGPREIKMCPHGPQNPIPQTPVCTIACAMTLWPSCLPAQRLWLLQLVPACSFRSADWGVCPQEFSTYQQPRPSSDTYKIICSHFCVVAVLSGQNFWTFTPSSTSLKKQWIAKAHTFLVSGGWTRLVYLLVSQ